ncbi:cobalamin biosynthesis protein CobD [Thermoplasmatales archaeon BRNA1]|nr:cobalamin biosynthesis protein CobD [Thermoplasmatales archaeon BRNA1]
MELWIDAVLIAISTLLIDRYVGDVPNRYHPLRWMGNLLDAIDRRLHNRTSWWATVVGFLSYMLVLVLFSFAALMILMLVRYGLAGVCGFEIFGQGSDLGEIAWIVMTGLLVKVTYSLFLFRKNCSVIMDDLRNGDLDAAADKTQMMVNRKTRGMDEPHLTSSCCETISENLVDSVVSPFFYYGILGMFGAVMFRCANLMDAMWGRRNEKYNMLGHFPARWDDVLGFIPSRLSPLFIGFAAWLMRLKNRRPAMKAAIREHKLTPSPNSGWPMTATAAAMGISFEKKDVYVMGEGPLPSIDDIARCYRLIEVTSILFMFIIAVPVSILLGIHVQVAMEDWLHDIIEVF